MPRSRQVSRGSPTVVEVERRFRKAVNMTAGQIATWLRTAESKAVGFTYPGAVESVGRQSARKIIRLLRNTGSRSAADLAHMRKVTGYVARHLAQRPAGDVSRTPWRFSLMNWGCDPLKRGRL